MSESLHQMIGERVAAVTPWQDVNTGVGFDNSWGNVGSGNEDAEFRRVGDRVELRGYISGGTSGNSAFTLPVGFRPPGGQIRIPIYANSDIARVNVQNDGDVIPIDMGTSSVATACSLNGVWFSVTA